MTAVPMAAATMMADAGRDGDHGGRVHTLVGIELTGSGVRATYSDGSSERIENGRYSRTNAAGRRVEKRVASGADLARLRAMAANVSIKSVRSAQSSKAKPAKVQISGKDVAVTYSNGWVEHIENGRYRLSDPYNRLVAQRQATEQDRDRLRKAVSP